MDLKRGLYILCEDRNEFDKIIQKINNTNKFLKITFQYNKIIKALVLRETEQGKKVFFTEYSKKKEYTLIDISFFDIKKYKRKKIYGKN